MPFIEAKIKNIQKYQYDGACVYGAHSLERAGVFLAIAELVVSEDSASKIQRVFLLKRYLLWSGLKAGKTIKLNYADEPRPRKLLELKRGYSYLLITDKNLPDPMPLNSKGLLISGTSINIYSTWNKRDLITGAIATLVIILSAIYIFWMM